MEDGFGIEKVVGLVSVREAVAFFHPKEQGLGPLPGNRQIEHS